MPALVLLSLGACYSSVNRARSRITQADIGVYEQGHLPVLFLL